MKTKFVIVSFFLFLSVSLFGQDWKNKTLLTIDGEDIPAGEFVGMYERTNDEVSIDDYLNDFILYKQKIADAKHERLDKEPSFGKELQSYRDVLAKDYLTDKSASEKLLKEEYNRLLKEVNAWHILVLCSSTASPADTLAAWQKAVNIRERIMLGEPFEQVARGASDDPSVKSNGGNLGYFTAFQTVMPIENAAYTLATGELSHPVRSADGYHIIKVTDQRDARGSVLVAHIMKMSPPDFSKEEATKAEEAIKDIYNRLQAGSSFEEIARKESDHIASASNDGQLDWFGVGEMNPEFSEAAFSLSTKGSYSKPIRTVDGWHIIKLIDKKSPPSFEEARSYLESQYKQSSLSSIARKSLVDKLKKEYNYIIDEVSKEWFVSHSDTLVTRGLVGYNMSNIPEGILYSFANIKVSNSDFAKFVQYRGPVIKTDEPHAFVNAMLESSASDQIINYEDSILEDKYPEFNELIHEYSEGVLLFEISNRRLWEKTTIDTTALMSYYESQKNNYLSNRSLEAKSYTYKNRAGAKVLAKTYKKYSKKPNGDAIMASKLNTRTDTLLIIEDGVWYEGDNTYIDNIRWSEGTEKTTINGFPAIIKITRVNQPAPLPFEEVREVIVSGYLESITNSWEKQLKTDYPVTINDSVLEEVKNQLL